MSTAIEKEIMELCNKYKSQLLKPHKLVAILAAIKILKKRAFQNSRIYYDSDFKRIFSDLFVKYASREDRNRPYNPFFHLKTSSFWKLVPKSGQEEILEAISSVGGPGDLVNVIECVEIGDDFVVAVSNESTCSLIEGILHEALGKHKYDDVIVSKSCTVQATASGTGEYSNKFVDYLNSLQRINAKNESSIAESQACNPLFAQIHVPQPITSRVIKDLSSHEGRHVILTGHAGDGKSTVALEVFKLLMAIPATESLSGYLSERVDIPDRPITLVKDLSERHRDQDNELLQELLSQGRRFLLVSNTGTLLDFFKSQASYLKVDEVSLESQVLTEISQPSGEGNLVLKGVSFHVFNMALMDNLPIARQIFEKIVTSNLWDDCTHRKCRPQCPICLNIDLFKHHQDRVLERIFLAYRRMYEYGTRHTIRQLTEHIAYMVTSGLEETDIRTMHERQDNVGSEYMFFNRFFGDNGRSDDFAAQQMQTVREIKRQEFGGRLLPSWERKLWLRSHGSKIPIGVAGYGQQFDKLRELGSRGGVHAREQVRRILFFLYDFPTEDESYIANYLNSPAILLWSGWQTSGAKFQESERVKLRQQVFHVLLEHLTGVRLPEISSHHRDDQRLYVTLNRRRNEVRQSAQVVLAYVDWNTATNLSLDMRPSVSGNYRAELVLKGQAPIEGVDLPLTLPFLDYVLMRHFGELGEVLQTAYVERLERYKAQIQERAGSAGERVMLVRLKTDHTFRRQHYTLDNNRLEVSDV